MSTHSAPCLPLWHNKRETEAHQSTIPTCTAPKTSAASLPHLLTFMTLPRWMYSSYAMLGFRFHARLHSSALPCAHATHTTKDTPHDQGLQAAQVQPCCPICKHVCTHQHAHTLCCIHAARMLYMLVYVTLGEGEPRSQLTISHSMRALSCLAPLHHNYCTASVASDRNAQPRHCYNAVSKAQATFATASSVPPP